MKRTVYILSALLLLLSSCTKKEENSLVSGQWNLTGMELTTKSAEIDGQTVDVYIDFKNNGTYEMYQMLGQGFYQYHTGAYKLEGTLLSGNYHDLNKIRNWGNSYQVEVNGDQLIMSATVGSSDVYTYTRCTIPEEVKAKTEY